VKNCRLNYVPTVHKEFNIGNILSVITPVMQECQELLIITSRVREFSVFYRDMHPHIHIA